MIVIVWWVIVSVGFYFYLTGLVSYNSVFGSLASVIVVIAYLYISTTAFLFGAQLDAIIRAQSTRTLTGVELNPSRRSHDTPDQNRSTLLLQFGLGQRERLVDPQPGPPQHNDQPVDAIAVPDVGSVPHYRDDLIDHRRVSRVALALVPGRPTGVKVRQRRRRATTAGSIEQLHSRRHGSLPWRAGR